MCSGKLFLIVYSLGLCERNGYKMDSKNTCHSEAPYKFEPYMHKINGTIANAIGRYECNRVSLKQLLTDYNDVITYPEYLKKAINPW